MSLIEVTCNCGWTVTSNDKNVVRDATGAHDNVCPLLFKPDRIIEEVTHGRRGHSVQSAIFDEGVPG
jgi:hypothetical protein